MKREEFENFQALIHEKHRKIFYSDNSKKKSSSKKPSKRLPLAMDFLNNDPTGDLKYSSWLINTYLKDSLAFNDIRKANHALKLFDHFKASNDIIADISEFASLDALWGTVSELSRTFASKSKERAYTESIILKDDNEATIAIPQSSFAAQWWGQLTNWHQSRDYVSQHKSDKYPHIVVTLPNNEKVLAFFSPSQCYVRTEFMNECDTKFIKKHWKIFEPLFNIALENHGSAIKLFPKESITTEVALKAIKSYDKALGILPKKILNDDVCLAAVKYHPQNIFIAAKYMKDREKAYALCLDTIDKYPYEIFILPKDLLKDELVEKFLITYPHRISRPCYKHITEAVALQIVKQNGQMLSYIPSSAKTEAVCLAALENSPLALGQCAHIMPKLITQELIEKNIKLDPLAVCTLPLDLMTRENLSMAIKLSGLLIRFIPRDLLDEELYTVAVEQNPKAAHFLPQIMRNKPQFADAMIEVSKPLALAELETELHQLFPSRHWMPQKTLHQQRKDRQEATTANTGFLDTIKKYYFHPEANLPKL